MTNRPPHPPPRLPADFENRHPLRDRLGPPPIGARRPPPEFPPQMRPVAARPPRETRRAPRRGNGLVKALAYLGVGVLVLGLGAAAFVALAPPVELIRDRVAAEVKARTGRDLVIAGPTSLRLFPAPGVTMSDVKLSAPPGMGGAPTVAMNRLDVSVKFMPLLRQQVVVERIALKDPVFDLRIDANGRKSWQFASASDDGLVRLAQAQPPAGTASDAPPAANAKPPAPKAGGTSAAALEDISIDEVTIENGTVHYTDARSGVQHDASNIEARFKMPSLARALEGEGELAWGGEQMSFKGSVAPVKNLLEGHTAKLALNIGGRPMTVLFNGNLWTKDGVGVDGALDAKFHSLDALAAWLKKPDLAVGNIDSVAIAGQLQATDDQTKLSNATLSLDDVTARGSVIVKRGPQRPLITADLQIAELDLNRFRSDGAPAATAETPAATSQQPGSRPAGDDPIGKLLQQGEAAPPGPRVKGFTQRAGWSAEPYDLKALGLADVDAKLAVGKVRTRTMTMHDTRLRVALKDKVMRTTFDEVHLYDGKGQGFVTIEASENGAARVGANFAFEDISAQPLLRETADIDWLAGKGRLTLALASQGESETQIVDNLNGKAGLVINDGALIGVDIDGALRGLSEGRLDGLRTDPSQKTNFNEMVANFVITNGVAKNDDLRITSPMLQVTGTGLVMLPQREIDYTVRPKVVALQGQSNTAANVVNGLEIPVRIHGDWNKPKFKADVKNVLDNPRTKEAVRDIKRQYKGKSAEDIVNDLMSKDEKGKSKAKKLLDKFLKPDGDE